MGSWGAGTFDNDDAGDWMDDLDDSADPTAFAAQTLRAAVDAEYVDLTEGNQAIAAAAWLAAAVPGGPAITLAYPPATQSAPPTPELAHLALEALDRATGGSSEWRELWDEAGIAHESLAAVAPVVAALRTIA